MTSETVPTLDVAIVTGLSGAGRGTAMRALEDQGWEVVDNLPLALIPRLAEPAEGAARSLALGIDTRTRGFSAEALVDAVASLRGRPGVAPTLVFLDAADEVLIARYAETRRRHPMAPDDSVAIGVERERDILSGVRERADLVIDTTRLTPHDLKDEIARLLARPGGPGLTVTIQSFAYKRGAPRECDMVLDVRFLRNPHWERDLRALDGRDPAVDAHVAADPLFAAFFERLADLATLLLPAYKREGKAYLGIGIGCTGGRHRSVAVAERLARRLTSEGWRVNLRHRELDRRGAGDPPDGASGAGGAA
jgi:UPF0042 nucleotide-binding protein